MSTPEEQQRRRRDPRADAQPPVPQPPVQDDPYGTQTWQSDTWDTGYQPVHPPLGAVPGQPVAPEGWFRDEPPAPEGAHPQQQPPSYGQPQYGQPSYGQPSYGQAPHGQPPATPDGWSREEAPAPGTPAAAETAYLPPYRAEEPPAEATAYLPPYREPAAPDAWFRDGAPQAPAQDWSQGGAGAARPDAPAAEQTAYLPPYPGPDGVRAGSGAHAAPRGQAPAGAPEPAAEQTAYLPPYPGPDGVRAGSGAHRAGPSHARPDGPGAAPAFGARPEPAPASGRHGRPAHAAGPAAHAGPAADAPAPPPVPGTHPGAGSRGADGEEPAYSPPTLAGNTLRAVDPAQARAEGRSPIIDPGPQPAILTAALGLLLAGAAVLGPYALLVPLVALQALTAAGWFRLNGMWPARQGIALAFAGALVADAAVLAVDGASGPAAIVGTLGAWVLLTLVLQLRSHADPDERMYGLMASVASAALAVVCAGYLAADSAAVTVGAAAVAVAVFARALPLPTAPSVGVSLAAAAGAGIAVGGLTSVGVGGALIGLVAGVCALVGLRVAAYDYPSKFVHMTAGVALPLAAAAPAVYLIGRVVG
ncbi:hypothetical protein OG479_16290 [Streptomyces subrutilus]|nr:hypothetical protein OG479_16290 [Streptomyces subrutilus]